MSVRLRTSVVLRGNQAYLSLVNHGVTGSSVRVTSSQSTLESPTGRICVSQSNLSLILLMSVFNFPTNKLLPSFSTKLSDEGLIT
jgi:hypothetical protein